MERQNSVLELLRNGNNCAQSVFSAFAAGGAVDEAAARAVSAGFGGGMAVEILESLV